MADKDFVIKNGLVVGDTATINGVQIDPSGAISNQVLKFNGTKFTPASEGDISGTVYSATIGDGTNSSYAITHGFGTRNVVVVIRNAASPYEVIQARWEATTTNTITVDFSSPVASESIIVSVYGAVTGISTGSSYYQTIGNGTDSSFTLTHNFNTRDVVVTARNAASPYEVINVRWEAATANTAIIDFSAAPSSNSVRVGVYATVSGSAVTSLDDIGDIIIASAEEFQTLQYNGVNWVNNYSPVVSYVRNAEANTLTTGTVVYLFGSTGDHATVKRADHNAEATSSKTVGVVGANIASSENGPVVTRGYVDGINLSVGYTAGDVLWLGENGAFTKTKPTSPDHLVYIGVVVRATNNGIIYVATQNGYELDELHDVSITDKASGDFLKYNGSLWVNDQINLGTDTVGNYMSNVTAGNLISITHTPGEGSSAAIAVTSGTSGQIIVANSAGVPTWVSETGDVTISDTGVTAIASNVIVNADINTAAAIAYSKLSLSNSVLNADISTSAAIAHSKLANATAGQVLLGTTTTGVVTATTISGDITINGAGVATIAANSVALGTDTTGDYVSSLVAGTGISLTNNTGEGATPTVTVNTSVIAPLASPSLTGVPLAPTAANTTNNTQIATTAYVKTVINDLINSAPATLDTLGEIATSLANNASLSSSLTSSIALKAPLADPTFTGTVTIPAGASISGFAPLASPALTGTPAAPTAAADTNTTQIATTAYVVGQGYAKLASPTFTGTPTLPTGTIATTQTAADSTTKVATTAFVTTANNLKANIASPTFTGTIGSTGGVIELGSGRATNGFAYIDLVSESTGGTYLDYGTRLIRGDTGANATSQLLHRGTGDFQFNLQEAAALKFFTTSTERMRINADGTVTFIGTVTGNPAVATTSTGTSGFGYMGLPQNGATTGAYGVVAADAGTHIYSSATRTVTLPANGTIAMPIGSTVVFIAGPGATVTIAITTDTMYLAGLGSTGSRTLAPFGMATAVKITATSWIISGNGLT